MKVSDEENLTMHEQQLVMLQTVNGMALLGKLIDIVDRELLGIFYRLSEPRQLVIMNSGGVQKYAIIPNYGCRVSEVAADKVSIVSTELSEDMRNSYLQSTSSLDLSPMSGLNTSAVNPRSN